MRAMKDRAIVCNIGHFDNEIQIAGLRNLKWTNIKPQVDEIEFPDKHRVILLSRSYGQRQAIAAMNSQADLTLASPAPVARSGPAMALSPIAVLPVVTSVAVFIRAVRACSVFTLLRISFNNAIAPANWGHAAEVPEKMPQPVFFRPDGKFSPSSVAVVGTGSMM
jgi:hypothetical protein